MRKLYNNKILLILFVALGFRIISLNQSLWLDEAIGAIAVHDYSYFGLINDYILGDTHPPLYYVTLKFWTDIVGYSEIAMRVLSVLFGILTVYIVYLIAKVKNYGENNTFPFLAALLFATAPLHIYYSQEVRMYALNTLLVSLVVFFYIKKDWWKYSITVLLLGMTDYLPLLVLPALWSYAFFEKHDFALWKRIVLTHIPLGLFLAFWFPTFLIQSQGSKEALELFRGWGDLIGRAGIKELVLVWVKFIIGRISFDSKLFYGFIVLFMTVLVSYPFIKSAFELAKTKLFWFWLIVPVGLTFIGAIFVPGFSYFRMIIVLPAFYLLLSYGLAKINSRTLILILLCLQCALSFEYLFNDKHHREDWRGSFSYVHASYSHNTIVLQAFPEPFAGYRWYAKENDMKAYGATGELGSTAEEIGELTNKYIENVEGVFYYDYLADQTDPNEVIRNTLVNNGFTEVEVRDFRGVGFVRHYQRE